MKPPSGNSTQFTTTGANKFSKTTSDTTTTQYTNMLYSGNQLRTNTQYTIKVKGKAGDKYRTSSGTYGVCTTGEVFTIGSDGIGICTFTTKENYEGVQGYAILQNYSANNTLPLTEITIAEGTEPTYEPYTGGIPAPNPDYEEEINGAGINGIINEKIVNRNLFDKANISWYRNNSSDFSNTLNSSTERIRTSPFQLIPGKTYKVSGYPSSVTLKAIRIYNKDETRLRQFTGVSSFTLTSEENYIHLLFGGENFDDSTNTMMANADIQIEEGSTATNYVSHQDQTFTIPTQQPMSSIGTTRDCFFKNTIDSEYYDSNLTENAWYEKHYIENIEFEGREEEIWQNTFGESLFGISLTRRKDISSSIAISNFYKFHNVQSGLNNSLLNGEFSIQIGTGNNDTLFIKNTEFTTVNSFKEWLSNHNLKIQYILKAPIDILCTEAQTEALEAYMKARTYKNVTHFYSEDETPAYKEVVYYKDTVGYLNTLEARIEALEGGN